MLFRRGVPTRGIVLNVLMILADALLATGKFLLTVIPLFVLGVVLAQLFVEKGWLEKLSWLARPFMRFGHLHPESAGTFIVAILSPTAAHSMLAKYHQEQRISRCELIITAIVNALAGHVAQGRRVLPVLVPLMGVFGVIYYCLVLLAEFVRSIILLAIGSVILPRLDMGQVRFQESSRSQRPTFGQALINSLRDARKTVPRILITMVPVTFVVFVLIGLGIFEYAAAHLGVVARYFPIPIESLPIVATRLASPVGAYTMAGSLLAKGVLEGKDVVMALLVATLLSTVPNLRYLVPYYFGIFGPAIGTQLIIVSTLLRVLVFGAMVGVAAFLV
jgi:hypothetical protein